MEDKSKIESLPHLYHESVEGAKGESKDDLTMTKRQSYYIKWSRRRDSNPGPSPYQGDALPAELRRHIIPILLVSCIG